MEYTVHRALVMLKTTKARIEKELSDKDSTWVRVARGQDDNISGVPIKDIENDIRARYDRITALISNYSQIKRAVVASNAGIIPGTELRRVTVGGIAMTVAEIIELQETVYGRTRKPGFKSALLAKMKEDYAAAQVEFDDLQERADEEVAQYIRSLSGKKQDDDEKAASIKSLIDATSKMLHEQKNPRLIDPLHIADKINALEYEIENFRIEADAVLSEENALTLIDIDLTEIK